MGMSPEDPEPKRTSANEKKKKKKKKKERVSKDEFELDGQGKTCTATKDLQPWFTPQGQKRQVPSKEKGTLGWGRIRGNRASNSTCEGRGAFTGAPRINSKAGGKAKFKKQIECGGADWFVREGRGRS